LRASTVALLFMTVSFTGMSVVCPCRQGMRQPLS
jgi:hypothetical protein